MTKLLWDQVGERRYEDGIDRGVLYLTNNTGVSWNGLTSIEEDMGGDTSEPRYFDGIKYLDEPLTGDFIATLSAFTYPDEFLEFEGVIALGNGLFVDGQDSKMFGLSYRTKIGNDVYGYEHGYKIHLLYNLTVTPDTHNYETLSNSPKPQLFSWKITGVPKVASGNRATSHVIFDSRFLNTAMFASIEAVLYGDAANIPRLPTINELINIVSLWSPKSVIPQTLTGLAQLGAGVGDMTQINIDGLFSSLPTTRLVQTAVPGIYQLVI